VDPKTNTSYRFFSRNGGGLRPDFVGPDANSGIDPKVDRLHFLNPAAFAVQPVNTPGDAQRNIAWGPHLFQMNLSLVKRFRVMESQALDLRLEAFNAFNNVNFTVTRLDPWKFHFGQITSTIGDARVVQVSIRYRF